MKLAFLFLGILPFTGSIPHAPERYETAEECTVTIDFVRIQDVQSICSLNGSPGDGKIRACSFVALRHVIMPMPHKLSDADVGAMLRHEAEDHVCNGWPASHPLK